MWNNIRTILTTALGMVLIMLAIFQWPIIVEQKNVAQITIRYPVETGELVNPYIGNAVWAENDGEYEQPFTLVYANLTWAELEPRRGEFAFEEFERRMHFDVWRSQGKHMVLRFVMDVPGEAAHADLPAWLLKEVGGSAYDVEYGRGFCPDYADGTLIGEHQRVIQALADRYRNDPFVAYIQLGSLGHWGEWHIHENAGIMPMEDIRDQYAQHYLDAFAGGKQFLMMRRPFRFAAENKLGLYNDVAGKASSTEIWLDWIAHGGTYDATGEEDALIAMPDGWQYAPIGGELATSMKAEEMLSEALFATTLDLFERSHTSWVGPGSFKNVLRDGVDQDALDALMRRIGYRLRVEEATLCVDAEGNRSLRLVWTNDGVAPFYFGWDACVRITDTDGNIHVQSLNLKLSDILPEKRVIAVLLLPENAQMLEVGVVDPSTGKAGVQLAMQAIHENGWYRIIDVNSDTRQS